MDGGADLVPVERLLFYTANKDLLFLMGENENSVRSPGRCPLLRIKQGRQKRPHTAVFICDYSFEHGYSITYAFTFQ